MTALRAYRQHISDLTTVINGIDKWEITPDKRQDYANVISAVDQFLLREGEHLPKEQRTELSDKANLARSKLPVRYGR